MSTPARTVTGPRTAEGKAISARSALADPEGATTHGLVARQAVLPHLGEDPEAYRLLLKNLEGQLRPRNLMEHQYLELWAEDSWKLRRLYQLERLSRLQTTLRR